MSPTTREYVASKCILYGYIIGLYIDLIWFVSQLRKAREVHPDKQPSSSGSTSSFHEVSAAYEALMGWNAMKCSGFQEFATTDEWQGLSSRTLPTERSGKIQHNRRLFLSFQVWNCLNCSTKKNSYPDWNQLHPPNLHRPCSELSTQPLSIRGNGRAKIMGDYWISLWWFRFNWPEIVRCEEHWSPAVSCVTGPQMSGARSAS